MKRLRVFVLAAFALGFAAAALAPSVQTASAMLNDAVHRLDAQQRLADRIYSRWIASARR